MTEAVTISALTVCLHKTKVNEVNVGAVIKSLAFEHGVLCIGGYLGQIVLYDPSKGLMQWKQEGREWLKSCAINHKVVAVGGMDRTIEVCGELHRIMHLQHA